MAWIALPSPNPESGGREATEEELDAFDEDAHNPQYSLVFDAWDAQFDERDRQGWSIAPSDVEERWDHALAHAKDLRDALRDSIGDSEVLREEWLERCRASPIWKGTW